MSALTRSCFCRPCDERRIKFVLEVRDDSGRGYAIVFGLPFQATSIEIGITPNPGIPLASYAFKADGDEAVIFPESGVSVAFEASLFAEFFRGNEAYTWEELEILWKRKWGTTNVV